MKGTCPCFYTTTRTNPNFCHTYRKKNKSQNFFITNSGEKSTFQGRNGVIHKLEKAKINQSGNSDGIKKHRP